MPADPSFRELMRRVRAGEPQAAAELHDLYGPEIRRYVRAKLTTPSLCRILESGDIIQSVLANFFVRVAAGQYDLDDPVQLVKLLVTMGRNRITDYARRPAQRRTVGVGDGVWQTLPGPDERPSEVLVREELLEQVRLRMTEDERRLARLRADGRNWQEIADECGLGAEAARKQLARALDRVCQELGIDEGGHA